VSRATPAQLGRIAQAFDRHGIRARADRLRLCSDHIGRVLHSMAQLTPREAGLLEARLCQPHLDLPAAVARLVREEERRAAELAARREPPPALDVDPGPPVEKPPPAPPSAPMPDGRVVGFLCGRTGRGRGCTPITERDMEAVRQMGEQLDLLAERGIRPPGRQEVR
jgi:hypothetical protein